MAVSTGCYNPLPAGAVTSHLSFVIANPEHHARAIADECADELRRNYVRLRLTSTVQ